MFAKIELLEAAGQKVILLPTTAILTDSDHARVIVASTGNVFRERTVNIGAEVDEKVRVLSGLTPGERVVTEGAIFIKREMESD